MVTAVILHITRSQIEMETGLSKECFAKLKLDRKTELRKRNLP